MNTRTGRGRPVEHWPVRVLMRRSEVACGAWSYPRWEVAGILPDPQAPAGRCWRIVHETEAYMDVEWRGLAVLLFRDAAASYWHNLVGRAPSLFVICRPGADLDLEPFAVSADCEDAGTHMDADDEVLSTPLPQAFGPQLENFVMQHYRPEPPDSRGRQARSEESEAEFATAAPESSVADDGARASETSSTEHDPQANDDRG